VIKSGSGRPKKATEDAATNFENKKYENKFFFKSNASFTKYSLKTWQHFFSVTSFMSKMGVFGRILFYV
jgi:hypothetical protein